jgi:NADP-dependent 3-hydroxy acid dehydrogenase YdfG
MTTNTSTRTAIVTGASSGIGRATATALASAGFAVVAIARRADELAALAADSSSITALQLDLTEEGAAAHAVQHTIAALGGIDLLVNAAGYGANAPSETVPPADWDRLFAINVNAVAHLTSAALPHLLTAARDRGIADVITISSTAGLSAEPGAAAYSGSKYAVRGLMESWRKEYAGRDVRFCTIYPGAVATEFGNDQQFIRDWYASMQAQGAVAHPEDIARAVTFAATQPSHAAVSELTLRPTRQV